MRGRAGHVGRELHSGVAGRAETRGAFASEVGRAGLWGVWRARDARLAQIGRHAPQFAGYRQQDSQVRPRVKRRTRTDTHRPATRQELMSFLLDGLHEDLNRVKCKV